MRDLKEVLEQNKEKYIEELKNLVGIDTHDLGHGIDGGLEKQGQEYMVNLFESMGADEITVDPMDEAVIQESYKKHQEGNLGHNQTDRANVYATFKGKQGGKSLLFNGHIDVMPAEMEDGWTNPPFEPVIRDGKMYGRGCTDMKGGLMASASRRSTFPVVGRPESIGNEVSARTDRRGKLLLRGSKQYGMLHDGDYFGKCVQCVYERCIE